MKRIVSKERCEELLANWSKTHKLPLIDFITKCAGRKVDIILYDDDGTTFVNIDGVEPNGYWVDNDFIEEVNE